jgi:hypothetical protein
MNAEQSPLWILTFTVDTTDPKWELKHSIVGTPELLATAFNLDQLPHGVRLLKGKQVKRYIKQAVKEERQYYREQQFKAHAGGAN